MAWTISELRHNASILYNHLCTGDANRVYVDKNEHLQVDDRLLLLRFLSSRGDSSREATDKVALRTLRRVLRALENGELDPGKVIIQEQIPTGLFMMDDDDAVEQSFEAIKDNLLDPSAPLEVKKLSATDRKWIGREQFGMNICNASRFKAWMPVGRNRDNSQLSYEQKICSKVTVLSQMILHGKESHIQTCGDFGYDQSDDESV